jgi:hypothetical protein
LADVELSSDENFVLIAGGLGNQLFQFAAATSIFSQAKLNLETGLHIANRDFQEKVELLNYDLESIGEIRILNSEGKKLNWLTQMLLALSSTSRNLPQQVKFMILSFASIRFSFLYRKPIFINYPRAETGYTNMEPGTGNFLVGYFQTYFWASQEPTYSKLKNLRLKVEDLAIEEYKRLAIDEKPLVVHVRLGDYKSIESFGIPSQKYYDEAISELWHSGDYGKIWIFTNEQDEAAQYLPGWVIENCRWVPEIGGSAAQTLEVMRYGAGYVIANSTYSWWGAFLSYTPNPKVIAPTPWFKAMDAPNLITPAYWKLKHAWY